MRGDEMDRMLAGGDDVVPSAGFTASVMDAVRREATVLPPIAFPWRRAVPGLAWCLAVCIGIVTMSQPLPVPGGLDLRAVLGGAVWIGAAIVVSLLSIALSFRVSESFGHRRDL